jgi:hypothetical protein
MLTILTISALHISSSLYAYASPEEVFSMPAAQEEQAAWEEIPTEPAYEEVTAEPVQETENTPPAMEQSSSSRERVFYKYGEMKTVAPAPTAKAPMIPADEAAGADGIESSDVVIAEPVSDTPVYEPEPVPLTDEELLVADLPEPVQAAESGWKMPAIPMPLMMAGGFMFLFIIGYWIWRIIPRFKTTMSKEAVSPPPVDLKTIDANQMARLKTALGEEEK